MKILAIMLFSIVVISCTSKPVNMAEQTTVTRQPAAVKELKGVVIHFAECNDEKNKGYAEVHDTSSGHFIESYWLMLNNKNICEEISSTTSLTLMNITIEKKSITAIETFNETKKNAYYGTKSPGFDARPNTTIGDNEDDVKTWFAKKK